ncbi:efflux RND transporter periplasmic adaptor subunit [Nannocystaceae bacterium ST9]
MSRSSLATRMAAFVLGLLGLGCTAQAADELAALPERARELGSSAPEPAPIGASDWIGVVVARDAVDLSTTVEGTLAPIDAPIGSWVDAGGLVATIEAPIVEAELAGARAALRSAEVEQAERALQIREARRGHQREQSLSEVGASSGEASEQAELGVDKALLAERRAAAKIVEQRAAVEQLQARLAGGRLHAGFRGRVARWYRQPGEVVGAGERVVRVVDVEHLWVRFAVPVGDLERVHEGQAIEVALVPAGAPIRGVVRHIAPELDLASQMMLVEAELDSPIAGRAEAGQACTVNPMTSTRRSASINCDFSKCQP